MKQASDQRVRLLNRALHVLSSARADAGSFLNNLSSQLGATNSSDAEVAARLDKSPCSYTASPAPSSSTALVQTVHLTGSNHHVHHQPPEGSSLPESLADQGGQLMVGLSSAAEQRSALIARACGCISAMQHDMDEMLGGIATGFDVLHGMGGWEEDDAMQQRSTHNAAAALGDGERDGSLMGDADIIKEAAATSAAARRMRATASEALRQAAEARGLAWNKVHKLIGRFHHSGRCWRRSGSRKPVCPN